MDITRPQAGEEALREAEETATEDGRKSRISLYRNAPVGLCVLDRDLRWVRINEAGWQRSTAFRPPPISANESGT